MPPEITKLLVIGVFVLGGIVTVTLLVLAAVDHFQTKSFRADNTKVNVK